MPDELTYSIKEMIAEFREDVANRFDNPNTGVFARLDKIDTKQETANTRTVKLEIKVSRLQWWRSGIVWFVGIMIALAPLIISLIRNEIKTTVVGVLSDYGVEKDYGN